MESEASAATCGHPNHGADDHGCRPFARGWTGDLEAFRGPLVQQEPCCLDGACFWCRDERDAEDAE